MPLKRLDRPDEVASVASLLLSDEASCLTGLTILVDGGDHRGVHDLNPEPCPAVTVTATTINTDGRAFAQDEPACESEPRIRRRKTQERCRVTKRRSIGRPRGANARGFMMRPGRCRHDAWTPPGRSPLLPRLRHADC